MSNFANPASLLANRTNVSSMRPFVNVDGKTYVVNNGQAQLHANDGLLMYDEWKDLDRRVVEVATDRLVGIADLQGRGLTHNLGGLGVTIAQWERSSDMTGADLSMSGVSRGEEDTPAYDQKHVPVPIVHKDFRLNIRRLEASRRFGESVDTTAAEIAARVVAERSEDMLFAGEPLSVDGQEIYGYTTHPDRNTYDMATAWDQVLTADNDGIVEEVSNAIQEARNDNHFGPYRIYVPAAYEFKLDEDYRDLDQRTLRQRIEQLSGVESVVVADRLTGNNVVVVQMARDTVDLAIAQDITTVQWSQQGGMSEHFKVMACWAPRVKSDFDGRSGIVHIRPA